MDCWSRTYGKSQVRAAAFISSSGHNSFTARMEREGEWALPLSPGALCVAEGMFLLFPAGGPSELGTTLEKSQFQLQVCALTSVGETQAL